MRAEYFSKAPYVGRQAQMIAVPSSAVLHMIVKEKDGTRMLSDIAGIDLKLKDLACNGFFGVVTVYNPQDSSDTHA